MSRFIKLAYFGPTTCSTCGGQLENATDMISGPAEMMGYFCRRCNPTKAARYDIVHAQQVQRAQFEIQDRKRRQELARQRYQTGGFIDRWNMARQRANEVMSDPLYIPRGSRPSMWDRIEGFVAPHTYLNKQRRQQTSPLLARDFDPWYIESSQQTSRFIKVATLVHSNPDARNTNRFVRLAHRSRLPVFRGVGPKGLGEPRLSDGGVYGPGYYMYTHPLDARSYASPGGGIIVGTVPADTHINDDGVVVLDDLNKLDIAGHIPTENTLDSDEIMRQVREMGVDPGERHRGR